MKFCGTCIVTNDVLKLAEFYEFVLQAKPEGDEIHMSFPDRQLAIWNPGGVTISKDKNIQLMYCVEDVDFEYDRLKKSKYDIKFVSEPTIRSWGAKSFWFHDLDGNLVSFTKPNEKETELVLHFHLDGKCSEAINKYKIAFNAEVIDLIENPDKSEEKSIIHAEMKIFNHKVTFSDFNGGTQKNTKDNTLSLSIYFNTIEELKKAFSYLSDDCGIISPFQEVEYSPCIINFIDRFGVRWIFVARS